MSPFLSEPKLCLRVCRESEGMTLGKMNEEEEEGIVALHFIEFGDKFVKLKFSYRVGERRKYIGRILKSLFYKFSK
jgi:hypothetical protein